MKKVKIKVKEKKNKTIIKIKVPKGVEIYPPIKEWKDLIKGGECND